LPERFFGATSCGAQEANAQSQERKGAQVR
jgi:hypothetical protein